MATHGPSTSRMNRLPPTLIPETDPSWSDHPLKRAGDTDRRAKKQRPQPPVYLDPPGPTPKNPAGGKRSEPAKPELSSVVEAADTTTRWMGSEQDDLPVPRVDWDHPRGLVLGGVGRRESRAGRRASQSGWYLASLTCWPCGQSTSFRPTNARRSFRAGRRASPGRLRRLIR